MKADRVQRAACRRDAVPAPTDFRRPVHCLLGLTIDAIGTRQAVERIRAASATRTPCWLSTPNMQYLIAAQHDESFRDSVIASDLSVADGMPLLWIARLLGVPIPERVAGAGLFEALQRGEGGALKVFFFGGPDGVAEAACQRLNASSGPLTCVGYASPGFGTVDEMSSPEMIGRINRSGADFLVVALGAAKGQAWIRRNRGLLETPVVAHLGAVINFVAGTVVRAPVWMQNVGLEWLWRIKEEPSLWRRYWSDAKVFWGLFVKRVLPGFAHRVLGSRNGVQALARVVLANDPRRGASGPGHAGARTARGKVSGSWSAADMPVLRKAFESLSGERRVIELDVSALGRVDGAFIALLMLLYGHQSKVGRVLSLVSPSESLRRIFRLHCAEFLLGAPADARAGALTPR